MTLTLGTHYKYDTFARYYYLTPTGAELITGIDSLDNDWKNVEWRLKSQGKLLKTIMSFTLNHDQKQEHTRQEIIEYRQYKNDNGELNDILYMLGEMAEWAWDTDGDRIAYEERSPHDVVNLLPITIRQKGRDSGLIFFGVTQYDIPEDEFEVGY